MRRTLITLAAAAAGITGCGGSTSDEAAVRQTMTDWYQRLGAGEGDAACRLLTDGTRRTFERTAEELVGQASCDAVAGFFSLGLTEAEREAFGDVEIRRATVDGNRATVRDQDVVIPPGLLAEADRDDNPVVLRKIGGAWRIEDLG